MIDFLKKDAEKWLKEHRKVIRQSTDKLRRTVKKDEPGFNNAYIDPDDLVELVSRIETKAYQEGREQRLDQCRTLAQGVIDSVLGEMDDDAELSELKSKLEDAMWSALGGDPKPSTMNVGGVAWSHE